MKAIMLTIRLKWFYLTYKGIKTIEVRKSAPKDFVGDVFEVVSKTNFEKDLMEIPENEREFFRQFKGKVGLKFTLNKVEKILEHITNTYMSYCTNSLSCDEFFEKSCLTIDELENYLNWNAGGYAWHISNLVIFDRPRELSEFKIPCDFKCPKLGCCYCHKNTRLTKAPQSYQFIEVVGDK